MFTPNIGFNFLTNVEKRSIYQNKLNEKIDFYINKLDLNNNDANGENKRMDNESIKVNLATNHHHRHLNEPMIFEQTTTDKLTNSSNFNRSSNLLENNESQGDKSLKNIASNPLFRSSWPNELSISRTNKLDKFRRLSLTEYPHQKLTNFTANFRRDQRADVIRRQNSAPEQRKKPFDCTIFEEEDERQIDDVTCPDENSQNKTSSKVNQTRLRRKQARYRTQPITFDEIKEVDEECLNEDNSINKLINFHIADVK